MAENENTKIHRTETQTQITQYQM